MIDQSQPLSGVTKVYYFNRQFDEPPMIHISFDRVSDWTTIKMKKSNKSINLYKIKFPNCFQTEFVFCNESKSKWDNPSQYCEGTYKNGTNFNTDKNGVYVIFDHKVLKPRKQTTHKQDKWNQNNELALLFVTDLDGTLLGNDEALAKFNQMWIENFFFQKQKYLLVYCTGRSKWSFHKLYHESIILLPDILITSTGGSIYDLRHQHSSQEQMFFSKPIEFDQKQPKEFYAYYEKFLVEVKSYTEYKQSLNWNSLGLKELCYQQKYKDWLEISIADPHEEFVLRNVLSVVDPTLHEINLNDLKQLLNSSNSKVKLVVSGQGGFRYMDLLPAELDKGKAVRFISKYLKLNKDAKIVGFGDSMNDLELVRDGVDEAVIVNNVQKDLQDWYLNNEKSLPHINISQQPNAFALIHYLHTYLNQASLVQ